MPTPNSDATGLEVATLGESMAALRCEGSISHGDGLSASIAGAESNVAIALARLGHRTAYFGAVGADSFGSLVRRTLRAEAVDTSGLRTITGAATGIITFERPIAGITSVDYFRAGSAGSKISAEDGKLAAGAGARIMHLTGITPGLSDSSTEATERAMREAQRRQTLVSFDVNYRSKLWTREEAAIRLRSLVEFTDLVIASEDELDLVAAAPTTVDRMAAALCADGRRQVVVKRGERGASVYVAGTRTDHDAYRVPVIDTIGAGDAFTAGYLSATLDGLDLDHRLARGCALGAFAVAHAGDWEGLPTRDQLMLLDLPEGEPLR